MSNLIKQRTTSKSQLMIKSVNFNLLVGTHVINASRPEVISFYLLIINLFIYRIKFKKKDTKWKVYADFDECEDSKDINILSFIRDVKFVCRNHFEQFTISKPPFIMKNWIRGIQNDEIKLSCVITYSVI